MPSAFSGASLECKPSAATVYLDSFDLGSIAYLSFSLVFCALGCFCVLSWLTRCGSTRICVPGGSSGFDANSTRPVMAEVVMDTGASPRGVWHHRAAFASLDPVPFGNP